MNTNLFEKAYQERISIAGENDTIRSMFKFLTERLKILDIRNITIDTSIRKESIKFFLDLGNDIKSTVKTIKEMMEDNYIIFTLYHKNILMEVSVCPIEEYIYLITNIQKEINEIN